ncbi:MAG: Uma2 family endonuclease [Planctomycetes bacterium]|nr:Uma2 family endonuclease [Planctomycetota bacterium]
MSTSVETLLDEDTYPSSDGKPMAETDVHVTLMASLLATLRYFFRRRQDVYVAANMFLYYVEGAPKKRRAPDVMVVKGVKGNQLRRSFMTWRERAVPSCIIELTSRKTAKEDLKIKKPLYRRLGVREYILFDPLEDYLPKQLMGYRLESGRYKPIKLEADGSLISKELGLRNVPEGENLALYDVKTGERLLNLEELHEQHEAERRRNAELEAELTRLKAAKNGARK